MCTIAKSISLNLTSNYANTWGTWEGLREIVQNWHDGLYSVKEEMDFKLGPTTVTCTHQNPDSFPLEFYTAIASTQNSSVHKNKILGHIVIDKGSSKLIFISKSTSLKKKVLLIGYSKKAFTSDVIGQFGEGLKVGALALVREGRLLTMETGEDIWSFNLKKDANFDEKILTVTVNDRSLMQDIEGVENNMGKFQDIGICIDNKDTVTTLTIAWEEWKLFRKRFLFLHPPEDCMKSEIGSLLLDDDFAGQLHVKGVWVADLSSEDLSAGVNFVNLRIDRDRNAVPKPSEIDHMVSCMWLKAVEERPDLIAKYYDLLQNSNCRDVRRALDYANENVAKLIAAEFDRLYGDNVFPVSVSTTQSELNQIRSQLHKKVVICNDDLLRLLHKSGHFQTVDEELRNCLSVSYRVTPIQTLDKHTFSVLKHVALLLKYAVPSFSLANVDIVEIDEICDKLKCVEYGDRIHIPLPILHGKGVCHIKPCEELLFKKCKCLEVRILEMLVPLTYKYNPLERTDHSYLPLLSQLAAQVCGINKDVYCDSVHKQSITDSSEDHMLCIERENALRNELQFLQDRLSTVSQDHQQSLEQFKTQLYSAEKQLMDREMKIINTEHQYESRMQEKYKKIYDNKINALEATLTNLKEENKTLQSGIEHWKSRVQTLEKQVETYSQSMDRQHEAFLEEMLHYVKLCKERTDSLRDLCMKQMNSEETSVEYKENVQILLSVIAVIKDGLQRDKFVCTVCMTKRKCMLFLPCSHYSFCEDCAQCIMSTTKLCPVCKTCITDKIKVYG